MAVGAWRLGQVKTLGESLARLLRTLAASGSTDAPLEAPPQLEAFRGSLVEAERVLKTLSSRGFLSRWVPPCGAGYTALSPLPSPAAQVHMPPPNSLPLPPPSPAFCWPPVTLLA
jgi:hypothetical protein